MPKKPATSSQLIALQRLIQVGNTSIVDWRSDITEEEAAALIQEISSSQAAMRTTITPPEALSAPDVPMMKELNLLIEVMVDAREFIRTFRLMNGIPDNQMLSRGEIHQVIQGLWKLPPKKQFAGSMSDIRQEVTSYRTTWGSRG